MELVPKNQRCVVSANLRMESMDQKNNYDRSFPDAFYIAIKSLKAYVYFIITMPKERW